MAKQKFDITEAAAVADELMRRLEPGCERIAVAGSLRRKCALVSDVEILFVPKLEEAGNPNDFFASFERNLANHAIGMMEMLGILRRRLNKRAQESFGPKNKLMVHVSTMIPVDLFTATTENWWNYLVCRTGPAHSNVAIASAARRRGWKWTPYGPGFVSTAGDVHRVKCEEDVFRFVGLPYRPPEFRL